MYELIQIYHSFAVWQIFHDSNETLLIINRTYELIEIFHECFDSNDPNVPWSTWNRIIAQDVNDPNVYMIEMKQLMNKQIQTFLVIHQWKNGCKWYRYSMGDEWIDSIRNESLRMNELIQIIQIKHSLIINFKILNCMKTINKNSYTVSLFQWTNRIYKSFWRIWTEQ